jgi:hypothetical protein
MTVQTPRLPRWLASPWLWAAILVIGAIAWVALVTHGMWTFTEARWYQLEDWPLDVVRFFIAPVPEWSQGRLFTMASWEVSGAICGADSGCTNLATAAVIAVATAAVFLHTFQLLRATRGATIVVALWIISSPVLATAVWQSARPHVLATIMVMVVAWLWWDTLGRRQPSPARAALFVIGSCVLMAIAFNGHESSFALVLLLPLVAILRGARIGAIGRNLALILVPLAYGAFYIWRALSAISPEYARVTGTGDIGTGALTLLNGLLGLDQGWLFVWQWGQPYETALRLATQLSMVLLAAIGVAVVAVAIRAWRRRGRASLRLWRHWDREIWVFALGLAIFIVGARSRGVSAHYGLVPVWALLVLAALLIGRLGRPGGWWRAGQVIIGGLVAAVVIAGTLTLLAPGGTWHRLRVASSAIQATGEQVRAALGDRPVETVDWLTLGRPPTAFYIVRTATEADILADDENWPYLVRRFDQRPDVIGIPEGTVASLKAALPTMARPGEVVIVLGEDYSLRLLTHEGEILVDAGDPPAEP